MEYKLEQTLEQLAVDWAEAGFVFKNYKQRGALLFSVDHMEVSHLLIYQAPVCFTKINTILTAVGALRTGGGYDSADVTTIRPIASNSNQYNQHQLLLAI